MYRTLLLIFLGVIIIAIPFTIHVFFNTEVEAPPEENGNGEVDENDTVSEIVWGVDSASYTDENLYQCVIDNFGEPEVWGRYLEDREGVSFGLDQAEVDFLHENNIQILVIYNHVNDARGYEHGVEHANQAINFVENLGVPEDVAIFGDIEPNYPVDSAFMEGWYDTLSDSIYVPGIYGVFNEGSELMEAYQAMDTETQENTIVWTAYPQEEITTQENAPDYNPQAPDNAQVIGWQYAIDAETCNIDTNLFDGEMLDMLWSN
ncbi:glycoside hydrolase domain-containing protein [Oceanobacillus sp. CAU 1775]